MMKNILAENMRRFHTKNLAEQDGPQGAPAVSISQPAAATGPQSANRPLTATEQNMDALFKWLTSAEVDVLNHASRLLSGLRRYIRTQDDYNAARTIVQTRYNKPTILKWLSEKGAGTGDEETALMKVLMLGVGNSMLDTERKIWMDSQSYLQKFNRAEKWQFENFK
jgi:hypothetical protein